MKKIAAITMLRNDEFFLRKWVEYYGAQLGRDNIYVYFDGLDQEIPDFCEGVSCVKNEHVDCDVHTGDKLRISYLSQQASTLLDSYDMVIGTDVDEFLIPDPATGLNLAEFLSQPVFDGYDCISGLGIDVGQKLGEEAAIDASEPFLSQRQYAKLSTRYSKASVLCTKAAWGSGFHRVKGHNFHIVKDLYLFHFGCVDLDRIKARMSDSEKVANGWSRHLNKRAGTIKLVSSVRAREWSTATAMARKVQNLVRPPYAWNKPAMFELKIVVRIPERFRQTV